nr:ketoacyl-ACP synthase III [uncultured Mogibacterium sp.]
MGLKVKDIKSLTKGVKRSNKYYEDRLDTTDEWIVTRTGIENRYITEETPSEMAKELAEQLVFDKDKVRLLLIASFSSDIRIPSIAGMLHKKLDLDNSCFSLDINAACAGFVSAMIMAERMLNPGEEAILIASEQVSRYIDFEDRGIAVLFGDGCAGIVVEKNDKLWLSDANTFGDDRVIVMDDNDFIQMNGQEVFKFAISRVPESLERLLDRAGLKGTDIDYVAAHQANVRILEQLAKRTGIDDDKVLKNIRERGNTSAASIPTLLYENRDRFKEGDRVLFTAFGAGLIVNSVLMEW